MKGICVARFILALNVDGTQTFFPFNLILKNFKLKEKWKEEYNEHVYTTFACFLSIYKLRHIPILSLLHVIVKSKL